MGKRLLVLLYEEEKISFLVFLKILTFWVFFNILKLFDKCWFLIVSVYSVCAHHIFLAHSQCVHQFFWCLLSVHISFVAHTQRTYNKQNGEYQPQTSNNHFFQSHSQVGFISVKNMSSCFSILASAAGQCMHTGPL
jgi:hypothetical protein